MNFIPSYVHHYIALMLATYHKFNALLTALKYQNHGILPLQKAET